MESHEEQHRLEAQDRLDLVERRAFLQILAGSFAALSLPGCEFRAPAEKIIPYLEQPEEVVPGVSMWYASTCAACPAHCGVLVKTRDGRPIKIEGNPDHPLSRGGLCARGQASVLDLYDSQRLKGPQQDGKAVEWAALDNTLRESLAAAVRAGAGIRLVSRSIDSPSLERAIAEFVKQFPGSRHVRYEVPCLGPVREAHRRTHGGAVLPWYRFDKSRATVSLDADFLGGWLSPVEFTRAWAQGRKVGKDLSTAPWHCQVEARVSLTGANADLRVPLAPSHLPAFALELAKRVFDLTGAKDAGTVPDPARASGVSAETLDRIAGRLAANAGRSLVVSGSSDVNVQIAVNAMNHVLGNYGNTLDVVQPSLQSSGHSAELDELIDEMNAGKVAILLVLQANPGYQHPRAAEFLAGLKKVGTSVALAVTADETASQCGWIAADHHFLESWGDAHPHVGLYSVVQPVLAPLYNTRPALESLLRATGSDVKAYDYIRTTWQEALFVQQDAHRDFVSFWDRSVHDGVFLLPSEVRADAAGYQAAAVSGLPSVSHPPAADEFEFVAYCGIALGAGDQANNPWLQELPDPVSRVSWGNVAAMSPRSAERLNVVDGREIELVAGEARARLPVHIQPGMPDGVVAAALGYGRKNAGRIAANYPTEKMFAIEKELLSGADVYPLVGHPSVRISVLESMSPPARIQTYDFQEVPFTGQHRPLAMVVQAGGTGADEASGAGHASAGHGAPAGADLWPPHEYKGEKWAMTVDLNACSGCGACVIGCQAENNVPVVGKSEIRKARDMFWMRIDRYYGGSEAHPEENPDIHFMPMMCQHCDHAPCETVCPVLATLHSSDGLNMQVYNRCVGTRYCANNCPYKVRRFNWFDYAHNDLVQNLVLNPDVTVRTRGVMEKCSFCVQRIYEGRTQAKGEGRAIADGEVRPACVQSCPSEALVFGNINDPRSKVARLAKDSRAYQVLADLGVGPAVHYLKRVKNQG